VSKTSLLDENAKKAKALKPDKNGKSMKRKLETVSIFYGPASFGIVKELILFLVFLHKTISISFTIFFFAQFRKKDFRR
jgi:hypothetical protein